MEICKFRFITQGDADELSEKLFARFSTDNIPGFWLFSLGEKMRVEDIRVNSYVSLTAGHAHLPEILDCRFSPTSAEIQL